MFNNNLSFEMIANCVNLTLEEVENIIIEVKQNYIFANNVIINYRFIK